MINGDVHDVGRRIALPVRLAICSCSLALCGSVLAAEIYVVPSGSVPTPPYDTWATAAQDIQTAVDYACANFPSYDTVIITNGTYGITNQIWITNAITVRSFEGGLSGAGNTVVQRTSGQTRIFKLTHPGAHLHGLTLQGGYYAGYVDEEFRYGAGLYMTAGTASCLRIFANDGNSIHGGDWTRGGGVFMGGGLLTDSIIESNNWTYSSFFVSGGGLYMTGGVVQRCVIRNNRGGYSSTHQTGMDGGGGVRMTGGRLENCLIVDNITGHYNGGGVLISGGQIVHCTIADNRVLPGYSGNGAGVRRDGGAITNTIVFFNVGSSGGPDNLVGGGAVYSCAPELISGEGNQSTDPLFINRPADYGLSANSTLIDAAVALADVTNDIAGVFRPLDGLGSAQPKPDIGCYEFVRGTNLGCSFIATNTPAGYLSASVGFQAFVWGPPSSTSSVWLKWDFGDGSEPVQGWNLYQIAHTYAPGRFDVLLTAQDPSNNVAHLLRPAYVSVVSNSVFVSAGGACQYPYASWAAATTNILEAQRVASDALRFGAPSASILVEAGVYDLFGEMLIADPIAVIGVRGYAQTTLRQLTPGCRVVRMTHHSAMIAGFTICDGGHMLGDHGAGIRMSAGTVSNCFITGNTGGGHANPHLGGGIYMEGAGLVVDSVIYSNRYDYMGGAGVWMNAGMLDRCVIAFNHGGLQYHAGDGGSGVRMYGGIVRNCLIYDNTTVYQPGAGVRMSGGILENCTIADNISGVMESGGLYQTGGTSRNVIVWGNLTGGATSDVVLVSGSLTYSCAMNAPSGPGNISADPRFVSQSARNYNLSRGSPCWDAGLDDLSWMQNGYDVFGNPRIANRHVDIGAIETFIPPSGTVVFIR